MFTNAAISSTTASGLHIEAGNLKLTSPAWRDTIRAMRTERGHLAEKDVPDILKGFRTSPNVEADYLRTYLGIRIPRTPHKIDLNNLPNRRTLHKSIQLKMELGVTTFNPYLPRKHSDAGLYLGEDINALFLFWGVKGDSAIQIALHENMHAFTDQTNPFFGGLSANLAYSTRSFKEGLAEWGALETWLRLKNPDATEENILEFHRVQMEYDASNRNFGRTRTTEREAYKVMDIGHRFVFDAISKLRSSGLSLPESLCEIIMNPPKEVIKRMKVSFND